jgi:hypothetical protein
MDLSRLEPGIGDPGDVHDLDPAPVGVVAATGGVGGVGQELDLAL